MALNIVLTVNGQAPEYNRDTSISFEGGDADYWYLWPTMIKQIKDQTGELIDLYDDAEFSGESLVKVERIILNELDYLQKKKEKRWDVHVGTQLQPTKKEIFKTLVKMDLEAKLQRFLMIVQQARVKNEKVVCLGD